VDLPRGGNAQTKAIQGGGQLIADDVDAFEGVQVVEIGRALLRGASFFREFGL
jgi:hypothetical protein